MLSSIYSKNFKRFSVILSGSQTHPGFLTIFFRVWDKTFCFFTFNVALGVHDETVGFTDRAELVLFATLNNEFLLHVDCRRLYGI